MRSLKNVVVTVSFLLNKPISQSLVSFPMDEGPDQLAWEISPTDEKWWAAFAKQEGGKENADMLMHKFQDMIAISKQEIAYRTLVGEEVTQK